MAASGCAHVSQPPPSPEVKVTPQPVEVKEFFAASTEADFGGLQDLSSAYVDLSAYSHLIGVKYPRTSQVDVLKKPPARPFKYFAVLEYEPGPHAKPEEVVEKLKQKAREIGADAIILDNAGPDQGHPGISSTSKVQAMAIKYKLRSTPDKGKNS